MLGGLIVLKTMKPLLDLWAIGIKAVEHGVEHSVHEYRGWSREFLKKECGGIRRMKGLEVQSDPAHKYIMLPVKRNRSTEATESHPESIGAPWGTTESIHSKQMDVDRKYRALRVNGHGARSSGLIPLPAHLTTYDYTVHTSTFLFTMRNDLIGFV